MTKEAKAATVAKTMEEEDDMADVADMESESSAEEMEACLVHYFVIVVIALLYCVDVVYVPQCSTLHMSCLGL